MVAKKVRVFNRSRMYWNLINSTVRYGIPSVVLTNNLIRLYRYHTGPKSTVVIFEVPVRGVADPGSDFFSSRIRINLSILTQKKMVS
jgi:hypothetical protein